MDFARAPSLDRPLSQEAQRVEKNLRRAVRERILVRDQTCQSCREQGFRPTELHVAHITPMREFRARLGVVAGTKHSFRDDNLVVLCVPCHAIQESLDRDSYQPLVSWWRAYLDKEYPGRTVTELPWFATSRDGVQRLFAARKEARGWSSIDDLVARDNIQPDSGTVVGPTFVSIDDSQFPTGQPVAGLPVDALRLAIQRAGGRLLREGRASDFVAWYETRTKGAGNIHGGIYPFSERDAPTVIFQRPVEESLIGKIGRTFAKSGQRGTLRQLKVDANLYLLHIHRS